MQAGYRQVPLPAVAPVSAITQSRNANQWYCRRSRYQLEYQQAQDIMDGAPTRPGHEIDPGDRPTLQVNNRPANLGL